MAVYRKWTSTVLVNGQPEPNVKVYVYEPGTTNEIPIYEDEGVTPITQPILTDSQGRYAFFVDVDAYPEIRLYLEKDGVDFSEVNEDLDGVPVPGAGGGAGTFTELTDTPSSYVGRGGDVVVVKTTEDGIETQPWPVTGTVLNVFLSSDAADIGDYYYMYHTETGDTHSEFTSPSLSTGNDQLLWSFVTEAGQPGLNQLALGAYTATLFLKKSGNKDVRVYWKLFKRDTSGNETEILESAVSDHLTTDNSQYLISAYLNEDQVLDPTDRLVLKLYANVSGTGTDVTVTLTMEGDYDSRLTINVLSSAFNLDRLSDVTITSPADDEVLAYDSGSGKWINQAPTFLGLTDTPSSFAGYAKYSPAVKDDETGLDWQSFADMELESRTIYVDSQNGNDTTGDGSSGNPYKTVEKAISTIRNVIADGVTVTVHLVGRGESYPYTIPAFGRFCIGSGNVIIEGELTPLYSGTVSSATATSITDSTGGWTADQYAGKLVKVTTGGTDYWRLIETNTADTLTVIGRLDVTPGNGDTLEIYDWASIVTGSDVVVNQGNIVFNGLRLVAQSLTLMKGTISTISRTAIDGDTLELKSLTRTMIDTCLIDAGDNPEALAAYDLSAARIDVVRSWLRNATGGSGGTARISGPGAFFYLREGSIVDGGYIGVGLAVGAMGVFWTPSRNGARDVSTIRNCTTGLKIEQGAGASACGTTYVTYSGNDTDRSADAATYGWYKD